MVTQNWVSQAGKRRFSMSYCPEQTPHTTVGALLLPGFLDKTTPRLIQFHTLKNAVNPPLLGGFSIFGTVAA